MQTSDEQQFTPHGDDGIALEAVNVSLQFGGLFALSDVNFTLPTHTVTGLIGPNGAGKSTLVNVLSGLFAPSEGELFFRGEPVKKWSLGSAARAGVARTFQTSRAFYDRPVLQNVASGGLEKDSIADSREILRLVDLESHADSPAGELPFGAQRRLGVAIALASKPAVLLLDEPGAGLGPEDLDHMSSVIQRIRSNGTTILLVDHNMRFLMGSVDRVVAMEGGKVICEGTPPQVQQNARVRASYLGSEVQSASN